MNKILNKLFFIFIFFCSGFGSILISFQQTFDNNEISYLSSTNKKLTKSDWGVGSGTDIPDHVLAPFVDMAAWTVSPIGIDGAPDLMKYSEGEGGVNYYNLGFINSTLKKGYNKSTQIPIGYHETESGAQALDWGWGGLALLTNGSTHSQYLGIITSIKNLRNNGGDIIVSFGGAKGTPFWMSTRNVDILVATYEEIIYGYGLTTIDLDIEGGSMDPTNNKANAAAIKQVQDNTGVKVNITLPSTTSGLDGRGENVLETYITAGVDISIVNIMTMVMGGLEDNEGKDTISAIKGLNKQLINLYSDNGTILTEKEAYQMIGVTNTIGNERNYNFTISEATEVITFADDNDLGMLSFWNANRDANEPAYSTNDGHYDEFEFGNLYRDGFIDRDNDDSIIITDVISPIITEDSVIVDGTSATFNWTITPGSISNPQLEEAGSVTSISISSAKMKAEGITIPSVLATDTSITITGLTPCETYADVKLDFTYAGPTLTAEENGNQVSLATAKIIYDNPVEVESNAIIDNSSLTQTSFEFTLSTNDPNFNPNNLKVISNDEYLTCEIIISQERESNSFKYEVTELDSTTTYSDILIEISEDNIIPLMAENGDVIDSITGGVVKTIKVKHVFSILWITLISLLLIIVLLTISLFTFLFIKKFVVK